MPKWGGGILWISSDGGNERIFLGLKFFGGIQNNLKIHGIAHVLHRLVLQKCTTKLVRDGKFGMGFLGG